jgi:hypothetical protein
MTKKETDSKLTRDTIKEFLSYDRSTGIFRWRKRSGKSVVGEIAGWLCLGYRLIRLKREDHLAHRNRSNKAISNLRAANRVNQGANTPKHKNNTSGFRGVFRDKKRWVAAAWTGGRSNPKRVTFARCDTPEEAAAAFDAGAKKLWGAFYQPQLPPKPCSA